MTAPQSCRTAMLALLVLLLPMVPARSHAACAPSQVQLGLPAVFVAGVNPVGCVLTDVDGDGKLDALVAISHLATQTGPGELAFMRGLGDGTFAPAVSRSAGDTPLFLATADLNGDGIPDAVVTNWAASTVSVLLGLGANGKGNGSFANPVAYQAGSNPHHLVLADLNHDGILDIAVNNDGAASATVLLGHGANGVGDGTFGPPASYTTGASGTGIAVGDLDEDGIPDLVATEGVLHSLAILHGNGSGGVGNGTFSLASHVVTATRPYDVTLADVNGDGHLDLLIALQDNGGLWLRLGHGDGTFDVPVPLAGGSIGSVRAVDFDGDGVRDLVLTQADMGQVELLHGVGDGTFTLRTARSVPYFPVVAAIGDLDGDGRADVVVGEYLGSNLSVLPGTCSTLPPTFQIVGVRDVPNDQGGKLWVTWTAHAHDVAGGEITGYRVWRRIPAPAAAALPSSAVRVRATASGLVFWEAAAVLPAQHFLAYGYTAATPQDSIAGSNPYTAFFVTATTYYGDVFYDTPVDSGYSVDNLAPAAPTATNSQYTANAVRLDWAAGSEPDLLGYRVHRGQDRFFTPTPANLVGQVSGTSFTDPAGTSAFYYKLAAVDVHGNVGPFVLVEPNAPVAIEVGLVESHSTPDGVTLVWYADAHAVPAATIERDGGDGWAPVAQVTPDGGGRIEFHDANVTPGSTYGYRLSWVTSLGVRTSAASTISVPGRMLALAGTRPNPATSTQLAVWFTLPDGSPATLEMFDVGGRRALRRDVGSLGTGTHVLDLSAARLHAGVYLVRLAQGGSERRARVVVR